MFRCLELHLGPDSCCGRLADNRALTYMSIQEWIDGLLEDERLCLLEPTIPSDPVERVMLVSPEVWGVINGPWPKVKWERRCSALRADLEAFIRGDEISLSLTPYKADTAYMGLLDPPADGVWDIRSRDPAPGIRVLGQFAKRDLFVALVPAARSVEVEFLTRGPLGEGQSDEWAAAIKECRAAFRKLFYPLLPLRGDNPSEYVSQKYDVV